MLSYLLFLVFSCLLNINSKSQSSLHPELFETYDKFREHAIQDRRFKHREIIPLIKGLRSDLAEVKIVGKSIEDREIYLIRIGKGNTKVLLWSQMHGDESTATMAIMDIFNFFEDTSSNAQFKEDILNELSLFFIPMLNPDGAEYFQRRNALGIDLNRDALRLQTPEAQVLKYVRDSLQPQWGFNLHDQNRYTSAGLNPQTASISFLAPAYNVKKEWNETRKKAMQLVVEMNDIIQNYIPGKVGRYSDEFEPRAFGDNIQKWGTSTVLIETGGLINDREKQFLRKLNFVMLLCAFDAIANDSYRNNTLKEYRQIPLNKGVFHDLIIREGKYEKNGKWYTVDVGFRTDEVEYSNHKEYNLRSHISDIGDLHTFYGYCEIMARDFLIIPGKTYPDRLENEKDLKKLNIRSLLEQGYTQVVMDKIPSLDKQSEIDIIASDKKTKNNELAIGSNPGLILEKEGINHMAIVNGIPYPLTEIGSKILNN